MIDQQGVWFSLINQMEHVQNIEKLIIQIKVMTN